MSSKDFRLWFVGPVFIRDRATFAERVSEYAGGMQVPA